LDGGLLGVNVVKGIEADEIVGEDDLVVLLVEARWGASLLLPERVFLEINSTSFAY
jgi:hypothetical protein